MMRVVIYSRVSTDAQEKGGTSLETQETSASDHAKELGWIVVNTIRDTASGASLDRPGIERVRDMMRSGKVDIVLAHAVDRISRNQHQVGVLFYEAQDAGVRLEFVTEKVEESATGSFILAARAFVAEVEREKIVERTTRGKSARARSGRIPQGNGLGIYGYSYDSSTGTRFVDPERASVVARVFQEFTNGFSINRIANRLNEEGLSAFAGGRWYSLTVRRILLNETYTGRTVYRRTKVEHIRDPRTGRKRRRIVERDPSEWIEVTDATPAIVSAEVFSAANAMLSSPERGLRGRPSQRYRLTGRARCLKCNTPMVGQVLEKGRYSYYRCRNSYTSTAAVKCHARYVRKELLEESVLTQLVTILTDPDRLSAEVMRYFASEPAEVDTTEIARLHKRVVEKQTRLARLSIQDEIPDDILAVQAKQLKIEREQLEKKMIGSPVKMVMTANSVLAQIPEMSERVRKWVQSANPDDIELLLRALDVRVATSPERAVIHAAVPFSTSVQKLNLVTTERTSA